MKERFTRSIIRELASSYERRVREIPDEHESAPTSGRKERDALLLEVMQVERSALLRLRDNATISDDVARSIQRDLDITESHIHTGVIGNVLRRDG